MVECILNDGEVIKMSRGSNYQVWAVGLKVGVVFSRNAP